MSFRIVAVCTGNICRSPQVEYVLRSKLAAAGLTSVEVASCGIEGHESWPADRRSDRVATAAGFPLASHRGRAINEADLSAGLLLALDEGHLSSLQALGARGNSRLLMDFVHFNEPGKPLSSQVSVPDPYYEEPLAFDQVLAMIIAASDGLVCALKGLHARPRETWSSSLMGDLEALRKSAQ